MIHENIKNARKAKGISQEELAVRLHVVRQTVSKWEKGLSVPDADVLMQIADLLEVPVNELLGITQPNDRAEDLADALARLNKQLAIQKQEQALSVQAGRKRGIILVLSFLSMLLVLGVKNELVSLVLTSGCVLAIAIVLYRNLALLTRGTAVDMKIGVLKVTTIFNGSIFLLSAVVIGLDRAAILQMSQTDDRLLAMILVSAVILFGGIVSPKLPFNRHTGLRLPWTVQDEDTWNVAHTIIGYISLPLVLLYVAASFTISNFEAVTFTTMILWIGIPGLCSFAFWRKKFHGKL